MTERSTAQTRVRHRLGDPVFADAVDGTEWSPISLAWL